MHVGALRAWDGKPPVGIKVVIEGQEEVGSAFTTYPPTQPELFAADAMVIGDMGSVRPGVPTLTVALRGMAMVTVEVRTLAGPKHSGQFGGAAPDALIALLHALASLHDEHGDVAVAGPAARGVDRRVLQRRGVPRAGRDRAGRAVLRHRRPRRAALVRAGDHRDRDRRAAGRQGGQRGRPVRAGEAQPPRPPRAGPGRGAGGADPAPRGLRPFGVALDGARRARPGNGFAAEHGRPGVRGGARGARDAPGAATP